MAAAAKPASRSASPLPSNTRDPPPAINSGNATSSRSKPFCGLRRGAPPRHTQPCAHPPPTTRPHHKNPNPRPRKKKPATPHRHRGAPCGGGGGRPPPKNGASAPPPHPGARWFFFGGGGEPPQRPLGGGVPPPQPAERLRPA